MQVRVQNCGQRNLNVRRRGGPHLVLSFTVNFKLVIMFIAVVGLRRGGLTPRPIWLSCAPNACARSPEEICTTHAEKRSGAGPAGDCGAGIPLQHDPGARSTTAGNCAPLRCWVRYSSPNSGSAIWVVSRTRWVGSVRICSSGNSTSSNYKFQSLNTASTTMLRGSVKRTRHGAQPLNLFRGDRHQPENAAPPPTTQWQ